MTMFVVDKLLLESLAEELPAPLTIYDCERRLVWANTAARRQYSADYSVLLGRPMQELVPEADQRRGLHERALRGEQTAIVAAPATSPMTGEVHYFDMKYSGLRGESGEVEYLLVFATDVTARRQAEIGLGESEERFRAAFEFASIGMALVAPDGRWLRVNRALCSIVGFTSDELLSTNFQAITHPGDVEIDVDYVRQMLAGAIPHYTLEKRYIHKNGQILWVLLSVALVRDGVGRPLYFVSQIQDITEKRRLTDDLRLAKADLQAILDQVPARITSWRADSTNRFANRIAELQFGLTPGASVGKHVRNVIGEERYLQARPYIQAALAGEQQSQELVEPLPDGSLRFSHVEYVPEHHEGQVVGLYALATDVTALRNSYERIRELAQRVETVREDERRTVSLRLHEGIAQDLFAMKLGLDQLQREAKGRAGVMRICQELKVAMSTCMDNIRQLANDLLPSVLAHLPIIEGLRDHARYFARLSGLAIEVTEVAPFPELNEDIQLIFFRAAQEALTNVARHAHASCVDIVLWADSKCVRMDITDNGVGIDDNALSKSGSLGLLGIRERFEGLGGYLVLEQLTGAGTKLSVSIPRAPAAI